MNASEENNETPAPFKLPANVRVLIFLVSLPGFALLGMMIYRFIRDGLQADLSWFALIYGAISCLLARVVIKGHW
ncbi:MAG: hypothetical protein AAGJ37_05365 [Pseudomonadota bacterium]